MAFGSRSAIAENLVGGIMGRQRGGYGAILSDQSTSS